MSSSWIIDAHWGSESNKTSHQTEQSEWKSVKMCNTTITNDANKDPVQLFCFV